MKNPSMEDIRAMLERGELIVPPGTSMEDLIGAAEDTFALLLSTLMGIAFERITIEIIADVGMAGKIGMAVHFDPELTPAESQRYELAMNVAASVLGSRPPLKMASA